MGEPICDSWVQAVAAGQSFAEVGGLWGTKNEQVTTAALAGASSTTMIDVWPEDGDVDYWQLFRDRARSMGVDGTAEIHGSIDDPLTVEEAGSFDVVCCSGVLYHCPEPLQTLRHLRAITRKTLILGTVTIPEEIANSAGRLEVEPGAALPVFALNASQISVVGQWLRDLGDIHIQADGITHPSPWVIGNYDPWWWLFTRDAIAGLLRVAGFEVEAVAATWAGRSSLFRATPTRA
ncbi:MAG TPA: methyltransferase domain-containing protein [Solirubrobacterales bacterium]|nr:methyltransferase domain-containing protein [Solirubrobacterales bacterium]